VEISGTISDVWFGQLGGYVIYEYSYKERKYRSTDRSVWWGKIKSLSIGQKVVLYVNQNNPAEAFVRDLYIENPRQS
jgi:hypothetical protein